MHQKEASMLHGERVEVTDPSNGLDSARGSIVSSRDSRLAVEGEGTLISRPLVFMADLVLESVDNMNKAIGFSFK